MCERIVAIVEDNKKAGKTTSIAVSGSSQPKLLAPWLLEAPIDWDCVDFYFSDERVVPLDHPDSNFASWNTQFFVKVGLALFVDLQKGIHRERIHAISPQCKSTQEVAEQYEEELRQLPVEDGYAHFDVVLLGMGPDGHTCSLFPNHPEVSVQSRNVTFILDSPKPPKERITLTLPVLNHAAHVFFLVTGKDKAPMVRSIREGTANVPSALVAPTKGELVWFVDEDAFVSSLVC